MNRPVVYVSDPYSSDPVRGTRRAIDAGKMLVSLGMAPMVPHLSLLFDIVHPLSYKEWIAMDLAFVAKCDAVYRLDGKSDGADKEVAHAKEHGIPVFTSIQDLAVWAGDKLLANKGDECPSEPQN